jgi:ABC-2 type transport system permease protein
LIIWGIIIGLLVIVGAAKFTAYAGNPEMLKIMDSFPKAMLEALNMRSFNLTTVSGFFGIMFVYFGLMGAIAAAMWGSDMISKEERDKTVEFSLVCRYPHGGSSPPSACRLVSTSCLYFDHLGSVIVVDKQFQP